jgi:hypothetical protein
VTTTITALAVTCELCEVALGTHPPDGGVERVVEQDRVLDVTHRVALATEQAGQAAQRSVDGSIAADGAAGGDGPTRVRRQPLYNVAANVASAISTLYVALGGAGAVVIGDERLPLDSERLVRVDAGTGRVLTSGPDGLRVGAVPGRPYEPPAWTTGAAGGGD